jgi:hypothetical protein
LRYDDFSFHLTDWSNIPSIIPRFCLHLNKHLKGIVGYCKFEKERDRFPAFKEEMIALIKSQDPAPVIAQFKLDSTEIL